MRLQLLDTYLSLCHHHHLPPSPRLTAALSSVYATISGEAIIDASEAVSNDEFIVILHLVHLLLSDVYGEMGIAAAPLCQDPPASYLRVKLRLPQCVDNASVARLCTLIPIARDPALRLPYPSPPASNATGTVETIDATGCVYISLTGGRALRAAARRNVYLKNIFLTGSSVNAATVRHIQRATAFNRSTSAHVPRPLTRSAWRASTPYGGSVTTEGIYVSVLPASSESHQHVSADASSNEWQRSPTRPQPLWGALTPLLTASRRRVTAAVAAERSQRTTPHSTRTRHDTSGDGVPPQ